MKLKAIASIFKRNKNLKILTMPNGEQWITNGFALYSMAGMPDLKPPLVLRIFDIPEDKQGEWNCEAKEMPENILVLCSESRLAPESLLTQMKLSIKWSDSTYLLLSSGEDIFTIDEQFVKPLYDNIEYLQFFKRDMPDKSGVAIACYIGFELKAVIMPMTASGELPKELKAAGDYFNSFRYKQLLECFKRDSRKPKVDPETGEVLDDDSDELQETLEGSAGNGKDG